MISSYWTVNFPFHLYYSSRSFVIHLSIKVNVLCFQALLWAHENAHTIVPLFCFDPRMFATATTHRFQFPKIGNYRAKFLVECVDDLKNTMKTKGRYAIVIFTSNVTDTSRNQKWNKISAMWLYRVNDQKTYWHWYTTNTNSMRLFSRKKSPKRKST